MALCIPIEEDQVDHYLLACNQALRSGIRRGNTNTREERCGRRAGGVARISHRGVCSQSNTCERGLRELKWEQRFAFSSEKCDLGHWNWKSQSEIVHNDPRLIYLLPT